MGHRTVGVMTKGTRHCWHLRGSCSTDLFQPVSKERSTEVPSHPGRHTQCPWDQRPQPRVPRQVGGWPWQLSPQAGR